MITCLIIHEFLRRKINIIGAGISGLSAGCYLQKIGFETQIFEKHSLAGGLCTGWKRNGYTINCSSHWIMGSDKGSSFYKMWSEIIDMKSIPFHNHDLKYDLELKTNTDKYGSKIFHFYTNLDKLEKYLIDIAPEDSEIIQTFIKKVRVFQNYDLPPIPQENSFLKATIEGMKMARYFPVLKLIREWNKETNFTFATKLKNPFLKESFQLLYDDDEVKMLVFALPLAFYDSKSAGYPIGGSLTLVNKLEETYKSLGGKINFNSDIQKIIIENNQATGIQYNENKVDNSDLTISTADWYFTLFNALEGKYITKTTTALKNQEKLKTFFSVVMFSIGINKDLGYLPHFFRFPLETEITSPDGTKYQRFEVHIYNYDKTLAPEGKTLMSICFYTNNGEFWINQRENDIENYKKLKNEFAEIVLQNLEKKIGINTEMIDMLDIATPATFLRYTNNWQGSTQGWMPGKNFMASPPVKLKIKGLNNFYYASHWNTPGGGIPVALKIGRDVTRLICKENNIKFKTK